MSYPHPEFYEAKRLALTAKPAGADVVREDTVVRILLAIGYEEPPRVLGDDHKPLRVWTCNAWPLMTTEQRQHHKVTRTAGYHNGTIRGYVTGKSMADVARQVVPPYVRSKRTDGIREVPTTDYRYYLAGINPGHVIVPSGGEFGAAIIISPEQIKERLR